MLLQLTAVFVVCLTATISGATKEEEPLKKMSDCEIKCYEEPMLKMVPLECLEKCAIRQKRSSFFEIPTMPPFPDFDSLAPFPQQTLGEELFNQTNEKIDSNKFTHQKAFEKFTPNENAEIFHPTCINKYQKQYPNEDLSKCKPEVCDVNENLKAEILECSKDYVALKGYIKNYDHKNENNTDEEFDQNAGFKKILSKAGEQTKVFNVTTGGDKVKTSNSTLHYAKDVLLNQDGSPVENQKENKNK